MKKICFACFALLLTISDLFGADIIFLKNGTQINAKDISKNNAEISYRRADSLSGPIRVIPIEQVQSIKYENGDTEQFDTNRNNVINSNDQWAYAMEQSLQSDMGNNNVRIRFSPGMAIGTSKKRGYLDSDWIGGYFTGEVMWLHSIADYTGNFGVGLGIMPILSSISEGDYDFKYNGCYMTIPMQLQHVDRSGITFSLLLTPALALRQSIKDKETGNIINSSEYGNLFAKMRVAIGGEIGYNYKKIDFGLRYNLWIGNMESGFNSTIINEFAISVGYRIKLD